MSESSEDDYYGGRTIQERLQSSRAAGRRPQVFRGDDDETASSDAESEGGDGRDSWTRNHAGDNYAPGRSAGMGRYHAPGRSTYSDDSEEEECPSRRRGTRQRQRGFQPESRPTPSMRMANWDGPPPRRHGGWESESDSECGDGESDSGTSGSGGHGNGSDEDERSEAGTPYSHGGRSEDYFADQSDHSYTYHRRGEQRGGGRQERPPQYSMSSRHGGNYGGSGGGQGRYHGGGGRGAGRSRPMVEEESSSDEDY